MLRNALRHVSPVSLRRSNAGYPSCVLPLKFAPFLPHSLLFRRHSRSHRWYFLTVRLLSASLALIGEKGAGSNLHREEAVSRFCPTKR
jgi:hypothetical protein